MNPYQAEKQKLDALAKQAGGQLIDLSAHYAARMQSWADNQTRPGGLKVDECVGFINKPEETEGLNLVIDLQAVENGQEAILRVWGIASEQNANGIQTYNNLQMDFAVDYAKARSIATKGSGVTRDDLRTGLNDAGTRLLHIVLSSHSGLDTNTNQPVGKRYDLAVAQDETEFATQNAILFNQLAGLQLSADSASGPIAAILRSLATPQSASAAATTPQQPQNNQDNTVTIIRPQ